MADFISSSLCKGRRIRLIETLQVRPRAHLVTRLMHERNVPRFIVAPFGFGKTHLALDYAQTVFSLEHVSWIDGRSPCFLRDLDGNRLVDRLMELDPSLALVVFDDIPRLSSARADEFSHVIDELLLRSCEVLVVTTPSCDAYSRRHTDRIRIGCDQLLASERDSDWTPRLADGPDHRRIPLLAWGPQDAADQLVMGLVQEDLPDEVILALFALLALGSGRVEDLRFRFPDLSEDALRVLARQYPALGLSDDLESFEAVEVSVSALRRAFLARLDSLALRSHQHDRSLLAASAAQELLDAGDPARACDLIRGFCPSRFAADWLALHLDQLSGIEVVASVGLLSEAAAVPKGTDGQKAVLSQAWRFYLMGLNELAAERLSRLLGRTSLARPVRGWARCLAVVVAETDRAVVLARALDQMLSPQDGSEEDPADAPDPDQPMQVLGTAWGEWTFVARALTALICQNADPDAVWNNLDPTGISPACADLVSALLLDQGSVSAASYACRRAEGLYGRKDLASSPALALACVHCINSPDPNVRACALGTSPRAMELIVWAEEELSSQAWAFRRAASSPGEVSRPNRRKLALRRTLKEEREQRHVPLLRIRLLGGLTVCLDGRDITGEFLRRRKVSRLLCLMALNVGREVPRERVVQALWPEKDSRTSVKNLYSVWSSLRSLLSVGEDCPYLERSQGGFRLDGANVTVDVSQVRALCRPLLLETPDPEGWRSLLADFDELVTGTLLPAESTCSAILREREALATRLVDALLASSEKLLDAGQVDLAREYAARALEQGQEREDIYYLNMRCLLACGKREAAIDMYFRNRTFLAEKLGIDPSAKMVELYRSILEDEDPS